MREAEYAIHADRHNWKYVWFGEHHALTEYSHMSAPEVVMGYVAARTERIHLASGIVSFPTVKEHPVRLAERAAMLDHITGGRYEFGTGRGAGSHEVASFNGLTTSETKSMWSEVIREIPRMWEQKDYTFEGQHFSVPTPHNILPKPWGLGHPPLWVACGNPATFGEAGSIGIGAIAFNFEPVHNLKGRIDAYKEGAAHPTEIIGQYQNNNVMMTNAVVCLSDRERAREVAIEPRPRLPLLDGVPVPRHDAEARRRPGVAGAALRHHGRGDPRLRHRRRVPAVRHARRGRRADRPLRRRRVRPAGVRVARARASRTRRCSSASSSSATR